MHFDAAQDSGYKQISSVHGLLSSQSISWLHSQSFVAAPVIPKSMLLIKTATENMIAKTTPMVIID